MNTIDLPTPEMIKSVNRRFYERSLKGIEKYDTKLYTNIPESISRVSNRKINKIIKNFPHDKPIIEQSAYWIRAFVLKEFFPDANHRTALSTLQDILREEGYKVISTTEENEELINSIKKYRRRNKFHLGMIKQKDKMYQYLVEWLEGKIINLHKT